MPATITQRQVLIELSERYGIGVVTLCTGATTTLTLTTAGSPELRGPFTGLKIPVGTPVIVTAGGTVGERTYVSNWVPSTGVVTVSPAITTGATEVIIYLSDVKDGDRTIEAVNRALQNRIGRWQLFPLTFVPDGDLQGTTVTDYWTAAANGSAAYVAAQAFPATGAVDAFGQIGLNRVLQLTTSGGGSSVAGNGIRTQLSTQQRSWYFQTAIRLVSGAGTMTFSIRDNTNSADISLQITRGNDTQTLTSTTFGDFMVVEGTFQLPATCAEISPLLTLSATGQIAQMTPIIMFPQGAMSFPMSNRIESDEVIGNFYAGTTRLGPGGLQDIDISDPITSGGIEHRLTDYGDHRTVTFNIPIHRPVWYEEYVSGLALSAITGTTDFPLDRVVKWAYAELTDRLMRDEMMAKLRADNGTPLPSVWRPIRNAAMKSAMGTSYEPQLRNIVGRR